MKNRKIIVANWKMNPKTDLEARTLFAATKRSAKICKKIDVVVCPPVLYAPFFKKTDSKNLFLGAQNIFWEQGGSYTGEVSAEMVSDIGASFAIIGHSERRAFGETDAMVSKKVLAALRSKITVILCIGEKERDASGAYYEFLKNQIRTSLFGVKGNSVKNILIAYEPVWAIGKSFKDAMKPAELYEMTIFIKKVFADLFGADVAHALQILYGGSVNFENAKSIVTEGQVDGFIIGRESVDPENFKKLLTVVNAI
ncbi:MAG: triose-phosphate isomerase [Patescibacteria group bacterium]